MQRRDVIKSAAGALAVTTAGGAGLFALSGGAAAADDFTISDASPVTTTDGVVEFVEVDATHKVVWTGFDEPVYALAYHDKLVKASDGTEHVLYDGTGSPVRLEDFSSKGSGSDGWGGSGEYASEDPSSYVEATGPTKTGFVNANINWRVLGDGDAAGGALSVETPGSLDAFGIEEPTDGETNTTTLEYHKTVSFYTEDANGNLVQMGSAEGTLANAESVASFTVEVTNDASTSDSSGDGSSSTGT